MDPIRHVYIHVPFCSGKCIYCNFYSVPYESTQAVPFLAALEHELRTATAEENIQPESIYIGGGTPTQLSHSQLEALLQLLATALDLSDLTEYSIEANPGSLDTAKAGLLQRCGITRVSVGAQSMDDDVLTQIDRRHSVSDTHRTVGLLKDAGLHNIGLDLIACLPGVDATTWGRTLDQALALSPLHLSVYALSTEPGSRLHALHERQQWSPADTEEEQEALSVAHARLTEAGYRHYEVSNFARPGHACRHNTAVWRGADYIGFGPAASSRVRCKRWTNQPDLDAYCDHGRARTGPPRREETLSPEIDAVERFMFTFRLYDGIDPNVFANQCGSAALALLPA